MVRRSRLTAALPASRLPFRSETCCPTAVRPLSYRHVLSLVTSVLSNDAAGEGENMDKRNEQGIPLRPLGTTGVDVSVLCLGGFHIGVPPEDEGIRLIHSAID